MKILNIAAIAALSSLLFISCKRETTDDPIQTNEYGPFRLMLDHRWGPNYGAFQVNQTLTHPSTQNEIKFTNLKYYISNIELMHEDGSWWKAEDSYYLVDVNINPIITLLVDSVPAGSYKGVRYMIGIDSLRNVSGPQDGPLDPSNGMFWDINKGYIFIKAEGESPQAPDSTFSYHIGGYKGEHNALQVRNLQFGGHTADIASGATPNAHVMVNVARFWHGGLSFSDYHVVHEPGEKAATLADNFAWAFVFDHLHN